jgi:hypothetical protein
MARGLTLFVALASVVAPTGTVLAFQDKADGVFDARKPGDDKPPGAVPKAATVTDRDTIGFTQQNVAAQMTELEERMFRLSEALQSLEPENASRLKLALNFSREELILLQMKETQKLLKGAELNTAETEVRELLAKLEHLRTLLLAEDLDFQMKLARLRQMRETLGQLERIIKEERRELTWSRAAVDAQKNRQQLEGRRGDLEALVRDQAAILADLRAAISGEGKPAPEETRNALRTRQAAARKTAAELASDPLFVKEEPRFLQQADSHLADVGTLLAGADTAAAATAAEEGHALLRQELERLGGRIQQSERALEAAEFRRFEQDQARNRVASDALAETSSRLGDSGIALQKDLIRAASAMRSAEENLAKIAAQPASEAQVEALKELIKTHEALARAVEGLLVELRSELQSRIITELAEMHEIQADLRETTQAQAPRVAQRSRTALVMVIALARKESELGDRTDRLHALVEETEFGIALPTALRVLGVEMRKAQERLAQGDPSPATVALEKRVEDDLLSLLEAIRRLSPRTLPAAGSLLPADAQARERELNRLIAELKMIRLLQFRLNGDTTEVDSTNHPAAATLTPELRSQIEALKGHQEEIRDSVARLSKRFEPEENP